MSTYYLLISILIPIIGGIILRLVKFKNDKLRKGISLGIVILTSIITWVSIFVVEVDTKAILIPFTETLDFSLKLDGLGRFFAGMVSFLWPFALIYSFVYMEDEERKEIYNAYYIMSLGVVLGIAYSGNLLTMFFFYESLTFITLPLIIHPNTKEARRAGRFYLYFSLSGSSIALVGLIALAATTGSTEFVIGGIISEPLLWAYLLTFLGFGVKAAIYPFSYWLPMASAAPTPTTALLHAVAVVKAGAFAIMRVTYYNFNYELLRNTWCQAVVMMIAAFTIIYGSSKALKEQHFKRRLAYSTIANLSYIVFGVTLFSKLGLLAALVHMLYHSITKICLFFACGAIIKNSGAHHVYELNGLGKKMPIIFSIFLIGGLSLTGVPLFCGFISKWYLAKAAIEVGSVTSYIGLAALLISALLTSMYSLSIPVRAFTYKVTPLNEAIYEKAKEPCLTYLLVIGFFALLTVVFGICSTYIVDILSTLISGLGGIL